MTTTVTSLISSNTHDAPQLPSSAADLFALTDEQILDIDPQPETATVGQAILPVQNNPPEALSSPANHAKRETERAPGESVQAGVSALPEPPPWLADLMNDPQAGGEARDLWNGIQQSRNEAAAYREVFAKPEEARAAADRARALEEIDVAFFGGAGKSAQEISTGRAALAQRMLQEDPAAFREMVFAGLRILESAASTPVGARHAVPASADATAQNPHLDAYATFEKSANDDLERSVGSSIQRSLEQALPVAQTILSAPSSSERHAQARLPALQQRLAAAVREDVELALKSDTQLGEQITRLLSARRFDETTRSQVVRLINDRAQQLVPVATRRVVQDWTQTTFAAHRGQISGPGGNAALSDADAAGANATTQRSLAAAPGAIRQAAAPASSTRAAAADRAEKSMAFAPHSPARTHNRAVDYHRLSDEQILDL